MYGDLNEMEGMVDSHWYSPLKDFYLPCQMYVEYLKNHKIKHDYGQSIKDRIIILARASEDWEGGYIKLTYPPYIARILEERHQYDEAIQFYKDSKLDETEQLKAIERCKLKRDGIQYEKLRGVLRDLNEDEQKQLVAYAKFFQFEIRLRNLVSKLIEKRHGNNNWWKAYVSLETQKSCSERIDEWQLSQSVVSANEISNISFTTFSELINIVIENWEKLFSTYFKNKTYFTSILSMLTPIRNDIAHARLLPDAKLEELKLQISKLNILFDEVEKSLE